MTKKVIMIIAMAFAVAAPQVASACDKYALDENTKASKDLAYELCNQRNGGYDCFQYLD